MKDDGDGKGQGAERQVRQSANISEVGTHAEPVTECRPGCAACCIAPSIASPLPGMPQGKPAGVRCANLTDANLCAIHGSPLRPEFCRSLKPSAEMCGESAAEAVRVLMELEFQTAPR
jgi:uncharacterized protein